MNITRLDKARDLKFKQQVEEESGQNLSACYQCGKCTAGCPSAQVYDRQVSQIMRAVQMGLKEEALKNRSLWLCLSCSTCSARCWRFSCSFRKMTVSSGSCAGTGCPGRGRFFRLL